MANDNQNILKATRKKGTLGTEKQRLKRTANISLESMQAKSYVFKVQKGKKNLKLSTRNYIPIKNILQNDAEILLDI